MQSFCPQVLGKAWYEVGLQIKRRQGVQSKGSGGSGAHPDGACGWRDVETREGLLTAADPD